jgi:hypothetical protein
MGSGWQFLPSRAHALPAWEATEAVTLAFCRFSIVFIRLVVGLFVVLRREGVERAVVGCVVDRSHVFAVGGAVGVVRTRASHQFFSHVVDGDDVFIGVRNENKERRCRRFEGRK